MIPCGSINSFLSATSYELALALQATNLSDVSSSAILHTSTVILQSAVIWWIRNQIIFSKILV